MLAKTRSDASRHAPLDLETKHERDVLNLYIATSRSADPFSATFRI